MPGKSAKRYAALLAVRKRQEDIKGQALARARREHAALRHQRRELEEQRRGVLKRASLSQGEAIDPGRLQALYQYERHLGRLTDAKDAEIALHAQQVQAARAELESAMARRRIMEKLIERVERAERQRVARREQRLQDESSVIRFAHLRRTEPEIRTELHADSWNHHSGAVGLPGRATVAGGDPGRPEPRYD